MATKNQSKSFKLIEKSIKDIFAKSRYAVKSVDFSTKGSVTTVEVDHSCKRELSAKLTNAIVAQAIEDFVGAGGKLSFSKNIGNNPGTLVLKCKMSGTVTAAKSTRKASTSKTTKTTKTTKPSSRKTSTTKSVGTVKLSEAKLTKKEANDAAKTLDALLEKFGEKRVGFPAKLSDKIITIDGEKFKIVGFKSMNKIQKPVLIQKHAGSGKGCYTYISIADAKKFARK